MYLVRRPYPIPKPVDGVQKLERIHYATSLDLNMGFDIVWIDPDSHKLSTIITTRGKYQYLQLPIGVNMSPDIFEKKMSGLEFVCTKLDDVLFIHK